MARRLFRANEIDVCSLHFSSLEIGLGLLSRLFFAEDVGESVFNEGRLHYLSAFEDITG